MRYLLEMMPSAYGKSLDFYVSCTTAKKTSADCPFFINLTLSYEKNPSVFVLKVLFLGRSSATLLTTLFVKICV